MTSAPLILDTDVGGDPDDAFALAVAGLTVPELALVVTGDEVRGRRARFARHVLDLLGRSDVPVVAGADLGNDRYFCVDGLTPDSVAAQPADVVSAVDAVCADAEVVRWVGIGPMSNLAALLDSRPDLAPKLVVTQMGGAINYRRPGGVEHNFRLDPGAAARVLPLLRRPTFVISDVTFNPAMEVTPQSPLYRNLGTSAWATLLKQHLDHWVERFYPGSMQHDALTLATALLWPGIRLARERITIDPAGRMTLADNGVQVRLSTHADYPAFMSWLTTRLSTPGSPPGSVHRHDGRPLISDRRRLSSTHAWTSRGLRDLSSRSGPARRLTGGPRGD